METTIANDTAARLRRAITRLNRRLRASALGGISPAQASMLASIENLESPSLGDLAAAEQVQPPSVTRMVKSLEAAGFITLTGDVEDRRCTRARLTALGRQQNATIRRRKTEFMERVLSSLSSADQEKAEELVTFLEHLLEQA